MIDTPSWKYGFAVIIVCIDVYNNIYIYTHNVYINLTNLMNTWHVNAKKKSQKHADAVISEQQLVVLKTDVLNTRCFIYHVP